MSKTLFDKVWDTHVVRKIEGGPDVLFIDRHLIHEVTSPVAFLGLKSRGIKVLYPERTFATADHNTPTINQHLPVADPLSANQLKALESQAKKAEKYHEIKRDYREISIELAKAALEGFNLTYKELNEQFDTETDKRIRMEAEIATEEAVLEQEKVGFVEKERALQSMQHTFNELVQQVRTKENEKNLSAQRLEYMRERESSLKEFLQKAGGQLKGIEESILFTRQQVEEESGQLDTLKEQLQQYQHTVANERGVLDEKRRMLDNLRHDYQQVQRNQFRGWRIHAGLR